ncbi:uncharacterized protein LY89DRAFT_487296 [Mollisia scopiformis]|uniref:Uncharacterized protein n=1 Tax=Mollisia scopiformis TaxID=149040 RepID=A0A194XGI5_MOLSC|nr:uncharacterized protein LY89DRAFT_487296 [Mollisia scopiformis]KUJ19251.1 hypothetical protein LY89DRAFT_487296 [Mollisia scopiformis]
MAEDVPYTVLSWGFCMLVARLIGILQIFNSNKAIVKVMKTLDVRRSCQRIVFFINSETVQRTPKIPLIPSF